MSQERSQIDITREVAIKALLDYYKQVAAGYGDTEAIVEVLSIAVDTIPARYSWIIEAVIHKKLRS
jgi:hypothetical protein